MGEGGGKSIRALSETGADRYKRRGGFAECQGGREERNTYQTKQSEVLAVQQGEKGLVDFFDPISCGKGTGES